MDVRRGEFPHGSQGGSWERTGKIKGWLGPFSLCSEFGVFFHFISEIYLGCLLPLFSQDQLEEVLSLCRSPGGAGYAKNAG